MGTPLPTVWTARDVGLWLSLPTRKVVRMAREGSIPCRVLPCGDVVFRPEDLAGWLEGLKAPADGPTRRPDHAA
jgi:hypothetical protein